MSVPPGLKPAFCGFPFVGKTLDSSHGAHLRRLLPSNKRWRPCVPYARVSSSFDDQARPLALAGGAVFLTAVLANRVLFTSLEAFYTSQARADILAVIGSATLILYGLGGVAVQERKEAVDVGGIYVELGFDTDANDSDLETCVDDSGIRMDEFKLNSVRQEARWVADAIFKGNPSIVSFTLIVNGRELCRLGRFRSHDSESSAPQGGIVASSMQTGERAYLADLKVVPVKEVEFGFLPEKCQVRTFWQFIVDAMVFPHAVVHYLQQKSKYLE